MVFHVHKTLLPIHVTDSDLWNLLVWSYEVDAVAATVFAVKKIDTVEYLPFLLSQNQYGTKLGVIHHQS